MTDVELAIERLRSELRSLDEKRGQLVSELKQLENAKSLIEKALRGDSDPNPKVGRTTSKVNTASEMVSQQNRVKEHILNTLAEDGGKTWKTVEQIADQIRNSGHKPGNETAFQQLMKVALSQMAQAGLVEGRNGPAGQEFRVNGEIVFSVGNDLRIGPIDLG